MKNLVNEKKRIVILSDSCSLPREEITFKETYHYILANLLSDYLIINTSIPANTIKKVALNKEYHYSFYQPKILVIHLGIVDLFPRPYPQNSIFSFLKIFLAKFGCNLDNLLKKTHLFYPLSDLFNFKFVPLKEFKQNYQNIIDELISNKEIEKIIILGIVKPSKVLLKSKIILSEFQKYNDFLNNTLKDIKIFFIDLSSVDDSFTIWDGSHFSANGNIALAKAIKDIIDGKITDHVIKP